MKHSALALIALILSLTVQARAQDTRALEIRALSIGTLDIGALGLSDFRQLASWDFAESAPFPSEPDDQLTPGTLCVTPSERRYPERIAYCKRSVRGDEKVVIIRTYDVKLGFRVGSMDRGEFKIDHYIPLCAGGSNEASNLWPQHRTIYEKTDLIEETLCRLMSAGRMMQAEAIEIIKSVKHDLPSSDRVRDELRGRL